MIMDKNIIINDISKFTDELRSTDKWKNEEWVLGQYNHHIEECDDLRKRNDVHLQAELLDKAIIGNCLLKINSEKHLDEWNIALSELRISIDKNIFPEYKSYNGLMAARFQKFRDKLHL